MTAGLVEMVETNRDGRRPERTIYRLTPAGADELDFWLREMLEQPSPDYPRFAAALMFLGALRRKEEAIKVLEHRAEQFEIQIAAGAALMRVVPKELPRLFSIEEEYAQSMRQAELDWLRQTIADLKEGRLEWPQMLEEHEWPMS